MNSEEEIILKAVGDLKREKRLEIDIAEGGSLEELVSLLADQDYHVIHLSGHGFFDESKDGASSAWSANPAPNGGSTPLSWRTP